MTGNLPSRPLVSIVTVYYNRCNSVDKSVASLLNQTYDNFEIIVVDDGSTDGTRERLRSFSDPRLRLVEQVNSGFTKAIRAGIAVARGSLIAVHGSGDVSLPQRIERQVEAMEARPDVVVVGCHVQGARIGRSGYVQVATPNGLAFGPSLLKHNLFAHGEVMFRRSTYDACGGYRSFFRLAQDIDLWLRMSVHGGYHIVEEVLYTRENSSNGVSANPEKVFLQKKYSEFARQCAESVDAGHGDLLERHGSAAPFYMQRSARLSKALASSGMRLMIYLDPRRGWPLVAAAYEENRSIYNSLMYLAMATHRFPFFFAKCLVPSIKRLKSK